MGRKFKPGQSGNPDGGRMTVEVRKVLNDYALDDNGDPILETGPDGKRHKVKRLRKVAEAWVREAMKGNVQAIEKLVDRMDGKVPNVNMNVETPLDGADTETLARLQGAVESIIDGRASEDSSGDESKAIH